MKCVSLYVNSRVIKTLRFCFLGFFLVSKLKPSTHFCLKSKMYILPWNLGPSWKHYCPSIITPPPFHDFCDEAHINSDVFAHVPPEPPCTSTDQIPRMSRCFQQTSCLSWQQGKINHFQITFFWSLCLLWYCNSWCLFTCIGLYHRLGKRQLHGTSNKYFKIPF